MKAAKAIMIETFETAKREAWERIVREIQLENNDAKTWRKLKPSEISHRKIGT